MEEITKQGKFFTGQKAFVTWVYISILLGNGCLCFAGYFAYQTFICERSMVMLGHLDDNASGATLKRGR